MFEPTSRYSSLKTEIFVTPEDRQVHYKRRRFLPQAKDLQYLTEITVAARRPAGLDCGPHPAFAGAILAFMRRQQRHESF
jgi:hypothetical protein